MSWVAAAIAGSAVLGGVASNSASKKQQQAAAAASDAQREMFFRTRDDLSNWQHAGKLGLDQLNYRMGIGPKPGAGDPNAGQYGSLLEPFTAEKFQESPAYKFNLEQGQKAIEKAAAKRGNYYAPATLQDISKFSQGMASNEFNNAYTQYNQNMKNIWDRLYGLSGTGQNAAAQTGAFGTQVGGQIGENMIGAGNAAAAGQIGMSNAITGGVNNYLNYSLMDQLLKGQQQSSVGTLRGNPALTGANDLYGVG